jgi:uncharacterized integral membrane protein
MPNFNHAHTRSTTSEKATPPTPSPPSGETPRTTTTPPAVSPTRTSMAWAGMWTAAIVLIAFIVFILQNTGSVQVSFLGMHGTLPLAVGLLIAMVAGIMITLVFGTARLTQVRRLARRRRQ